MRLPRIAGIAAALVACSLAAASCGGAGHPERHAAEKATPAPASPTPDTTPIEPLRTPAGLVLKINEPPTPTSAAQAAQPTPQGVSAPPGPTPSAASAATTPSASN